MAESKTGILIFMVSFNMLVDLLNLRPGQTAHFLTKSRPQDEVCIIPKKLSRALQRWLGSKGDIVENGEYKDSQSLVFVNIMEMDSGLLP